MPRLAGYDALLTASALNTAPRFDAAPDALSSASPMQTIPFNVTGHPAMSVPVGIAPNELPISVQIVGRPFDEAMVFRDRARSRSVRMGERRVAGLMFAASEACSPGPVNHSGLLADRSDPFTNRPGPLGDRPDKLVIRHRPNASPSWPGSLFGPPRSARR